MSNQPSRKNLSHKKKQNKCHKKEINITDYKWCSSCKVYLYSINAMQAHEKSATHILQSFQMVEKHENDTNDTLKDQKESMHHIEPKMRGSKTMYLEYNIENLWREIYEAEGTMGANFLFAATNLFVCRPCQVSKHVTEILEHVYGLEHQEAINMEMNINENYKLVQEEEQLWSKLHPAFRTHQTYMRIQDEKHVFCFLCEKNIPAMNAHNLLNHIKGKNHMKAVFSYLKSLHSIIRGVCLNPDIQSLQQLLGLECKETKLFNKITEPTDDTQLRKFHLLLSRINTEDDKKPFYHVKYICVLCDLEFESGTLWLNHTKERSHDENVFKSGKKIGKYVCSMCNVIMFGKESDHHCVGNDGLFVPRVFVSGFDKETTMESLYNALETYGTITHCALTHWEAIFEFQERETCHNILQNKISYQGHILNIQPLEFKEIIKDSAPPKDIIECLEQIFSSLENFNHKVKSICEIINSTTCQPSDHDLSRFLERELSKAFNTRVRAHLFGSRVSGIAFADSDVDVFADTGEMYSGNHGQEVSVQNHLVDTTTAALTAHPDCEQVVPVPKARTPIVKFKYKPTNNYCDIAFRHGLGCENTKLIRFYVSLDSSIKPLIGFLKFWMQLHGLSGPKKFTSYAFVWLIIFFLQQLPNTNFPTVEDLQKDVAEHLIAGWKCSFNTNRSALTFKRIPYSLLQLVSEFFKFYNEFDFATFVVCPLTGKPEPKVMFKNSPRSLPDSMEEYVKQLLSGHCEKLQLTACCVQDPFELNHNISKAASCDTVKRFQDLCGLTFQLCDKLENQGHKI